MMRFPAAKRDAAKDGLFDTPHTLTSYISRRYGL